MKYGHTLKVFGVEYWFETFDIWDDVKTALKDISSKEEFESFLAAEEIDYETSSND
jgi:hypothetical protein